MYKVSYDLTRPWKAVMEDLAHDDVHEEFYRSRNPLVSYLHRRRLRLIRELVESNGCRSVLEVGCGDGFVLEAIADLDVELSGVEISEIRVTRAKARAPRATVVQGDAYALKRLMSGVLKRPAAGVVSGLPLFAKPFRMRLRLLFEAFAVMAPGAPFVQFTYNAVAPIPKWLDRVTVEASERVWMNIPPARVWVYRRD